MESKFVVGFPKLANVCVYFLFCFFFFLSVRKCTKSLQVPPIQFG